MAGEGGGGYVDRMMSLTGGGEDRSAAMDIVTPKKHRDLVMLTEIQPDMMLSSTILGVMQKRFHSKVLRTIDAQYLSRLKSKDRKGVLEGLELAAAIRRSQMAEEEA